MLSRRQKIMLAALAGRDHAVYAPVQVQKLFFLLDENIAEELGGKQFDFEPYDYGPFDKDVYHELENLATQGYVRVEGRDGAPRQRHYVLTEEGKQTGIKARDELPMRAQNYMQSVADWVCQLSFSQLVGSIYRAYPHMRANSIFQD